jgi:transcription termination/antitermination protein NusA
VPDYQLSLAIGKEGQNARLSARLTGLRVDIKSETQLRAEEQRVAAAAETETTADGVGGAAPADASSEAAETAEMTEAEKGQATADG